MKPSDISKDLRRIASLIENSKNPAKDLVIRDIKSVIKKIASYGFEVTIAMTKSGDNLTVHTVIADPIIGLASIDFDNGGRPNRLSSLSRRSLEYVTQDIISKYENESSTYGNMRCLYDDIALKGQNISHVCECITTFVDSRELNDLKAIMQDSLMDIGYHGVKVS